MCIKIHIHNHCTKLTYIGIIQALSLTLPLFSLCLRMFGLKNIKFIFSSEFFLSFNVLILKIKNI
jgi:hypothetical protein